MGRRSNYEGVSKADSYTIKKVKELRKDGVTQTDIASMLGISQWTVSKILKGGKDDR